MAATAAAAATTAIVSGAASLTGAATPSAPTSRRLQQQHVARRCGVVGRRRPLTASGPLWWGSWSSSSSGRAAPGRRLSRAAAGVVRCGYWGALLAATAQATVAAAAAVAAGSPGIDAGAARGAGGRAWGPAGGGGGVGWRMGVGAAAGGGAFVPPPAFGGPDGQSRRGYAATGPRWLNRLLFEPGEVDVVDGGGGGRCRVRLPRGDPRAEHVREILRAENGDTVRAGVLDAGRTDAAPIAWGSNGELDIDLGPASALLRPCPAAERPRVDILLAMQAPIRLERLVPHIVALGVGRLVITGANKVEKSYWGSHLFRRPEVLRELITEGLCQAGDTAMPEVIVERRLKKFLEDDLDRLWAPDHTPTIRAIAHPSRGPPGSTPRLRDLRPAGTGIGAPRVLLAVGPESGWDEPYELDLFSEHGFQQITMGQRVLRTEAAVPALMALAHDRLDALDAADEKTWIVT